VASIPIPGGRSLRPVKNRKEVLIRLQIKTLLIFTGKTTRLTKLPLLPPIFQSALLTKLPSIFFTSPYFHWADYTLNKTSSLFFTFLFFRFAPLTKLFPYFLLSSIFTGQTTPLIKLPLFLLPIFFQSAPLTKLPLSTFLFFPYFYWANYTLNKTFPTLFFTPPIFQSAPIIKLSLLFFTPPYYHWAKYTLNKTPLNFLLSSNFQSASVTKVLHLFLKIQSRDYATLWTQTQNSRIRTSLDHFTICLFKYSLFFCLCFDLFHFMVCVFAV